MENRNHYTLEKIAEGLSKHQKADEEFQREQVNHNQRMAKALDDNTQAILATKSTVDSWMQITASLSLSGRIILKFLAIMVAVSGGIAAIKYIIISFISAPR